MKEVINNSESTLDNIKEARYLFSESRKAFRSVCRQYNAKKSVARDTEIHNILTSQPSKTFQSLRKRKSSPDSAINELHVKNKAYSGNKVIDGFFENIKDLKTIDPITSSCQSSKSFKFDYKIIHEICQNGAKIPLLSLEQASKLLHSLKPHVCDHWSVSASH